MLQLAISAKRKRDNCDSVPECQQAKKPKVDKMPIRDLVCLVKELPDELAEMISAFLVSGDFTWVQTVKHAEYAIRVTKGPLRFALWLRLFVWDKTHAMSHDIVEDSFYSAICWKKLRHSCVKCVGDLARLNLLTDSVFQLFNNEDVIERALVAVPHRLVASSLIGIRSERLIRLGLQLTNAGRPQDYDTFMVFAARRMSREALNVFIDCREVAQRLLSVFGWCGEVDLCRAALDKGAQWDKTAIRQALESHRSVEMAALMSNKQVLSVFTLDEALEKDVIKDEMCAEIETVLRCDRTNHPTLYYTSLQTIQSFAIECGVHLMSPDEIKQNLLCPPTFGAAWKKLFAVLADPRVACTNLSAFAAQAPKSELLAALKSLAQEDIDHAQLARSVRELRLDCSELDLTHVKLEFCAEIGALVTECLPADVEDLDLSLRSTYAESCKAVCIVAMKNRMEMHVTEPLIKRALGWMPAEYVMWYCYADNMSVLARIDIHGVELRLCQEAKLTKYVDYKLGKAHAEFDAYFKTARNQLLAMDALESDSAEFYAMLAKHNLRLQILLYRAQELGRTAQEMAIKMCL